MEPDAVQAANIIAVGLHTTGPNQHQVLAIVFAKFPKFSEPQYEMYVTQAIAARSRPAIACV